MVNEEKALDLEGLEKLWGDVQTRGIRGMTQAEYDALPEDQKTGLVAITDDENDPPLEYVLQQWELVNSYLARIRMASEYLSSVNQSILTINDQIFDRKGKVVDALNSMSMNASMTDSFEDLLEQTKNLPVPAHFRRSDISKRFPKLGRVGFQNLKRIFASSQSDTSGPMSPILLICYELVGDEPLTNSEIEEIESFCDSTMEKSRASSNLPELFYTYFPSHESDGLESNNDLFRYKVANPAVKASVKATFYIQTGTPSPTEDDLLTIKTLANIFLDELPTGKYVAAASLLKYIQLKSSGTLSNLSFTSIVFSNGTNLDTGEPLENLTNGNGSLIVPFILNEDVTPCRLEIQEVSFV